MDELEVQPHETACPTCHLTYHRRLTACPNICLEESTP